MGTGIHWFYDVSGSVFREREREALNKCLVENKLISSLTNSILND